MDFTVVGMLGMAYTGFFYSTHGSKLDLRFCGSSRRERVYCVHNHRQVHRSHWHQRVYRREQLNQPARNTSKVCRNPEQPALSDQ